MQEDGGVKVQVKTSTPGDAPSQPTQSQPPLTQDPGLQRPSAQAPGVSPAPAHASPQVEVEEPNISVNTEQEPPVETSQPANGSGRGSGVGHYYVMAGASALVFALCMFGLGYTYGNGQPSSTDATNTTMASQPVDLCEIKLTTIVGSDSPAFLVTYDSAAEDISRYSLYVGGVSYQPNSGGVYQPALPAGESIVKVSEGVSGDPICQYGPVYRLSGQEEETPIEDSPVEPEQTTVLESSEQL